MNGGVNISGARLIVDSISSTKRINLPLVEMNDIDGCESFNSLQVSGLYGDSNNLRIPAKSNGDVVTCDTESLG